jgi:hypothetical protein
MLSNGVAYTNNFSTILRTARHAHMETAILPEHLAKASVAFEDGGEGRKGGVGGGAGAGIRRVRVLVRGCWMGEVEGGNDYEFTRDVL